MSLLIACTDVSRLILLGLLPGGQASLRLMLGTWGCMCIRELRTSVGATPPKHSGLRRERGRPPKVRDGFCQERILRRKQIGVVASGVTGAVGNTNIFG